MSCFLEIYMNICIYKYIYIHMIIYISREGRKVYMMTWCGNFLTDGTQELQYLEKRYVDCWRDNVEN